MVLVILPVAPLVPHPPPSDSCALSSCGFNAKCSVQEGVAVCICSLNHYGNPYVACRPECIIDTDCPRYLDCVRNRCIDPCPGTCGVGALCEVLNHQPTCTCPNGYSGNPLQRCHPHHPLSTTCKTFFMLVIIINASSDVNVVLDFVQYQIDTKDGA